MADPHQRAVIAFLRQRAAVVKRYRTVNTTVL